MTGEELKAKVKKSGLSITEMANRLGTSQQSLSQSLKAVDVKTGLVQDMARVLNLPISFFFDSDDVGNATLGNSNYNTSNTSALVGTMDKKGILNALIDHYSNGVKSRFAEKIGVKPQTINTWLLRGSFDTDLIYSKCEGLSAHWLLTGNGPMLLDDAESGSCAAPMSSDKECLTFAGDVGNGDATASGTHSVAAINSTVSTGASAGELAAMNRENSLLRDLIDEKERLLDEKERLIKVLMERK